MHTKYIFLGNIRISSESVLILFLAEIMSYSNFHPFPSFGCVCVYVTFNWIRCKEKATSKFRGKNDGCTKAKARERRRGWNHMLCQLVYVHKFRTDDRQHDLEELDKV